MQHQCPTSRLQEGGHHCEEAEVPSCSSDMLVRMTRFEGLLSDLVIAASCTQCTDATAREWRTVKIHVWCSWDLKV